MTRSSLTPRQATAVALFAGLTALGAFIRIPFPAVPLTLQTAAVLLSGLLLGPALGSLSQLTYVIIGLLGAPVFSQGGGPGYVLNPTFGYLCGFIGGAATTGFLAGDWRRSGMPRLLAAMVAGLAVIYIVGVGYLYWNLVFFQEKTVSLQHIAKIGLLLPLPGDMVKILLLLPLIKILRRRVFLLLDAGR